MTNTSVLTSIETVVIFRSGRATKTVQLQKSDKRQIGGTNWVSTAVGTATNIVVPHRANIILAQIAAPQSTFISVDKLILMTSLKLVRSISASCEALSE